MKHIDKGIMLLGPVLVGLLAWPACLPSEGGAPRGGDDGSALELDDSAEIPCGPRRVLKEVCQQCHARPTKNGAPFPLERRSDVHARYGGVPVHELMVQQLDARRMPLAPVTIGGPEREVLLAWLRAGAPGVPAQSCVADAGPDSAAGGDAEAPPDEPSDAEAPADAWCDADASGY